MSEFTCENYVVDLSSIFSYLSTRKVSSILLQAPDGLKKLYKCIGEEIKSRLPDAEIYYSSSPIYGACDIPREEIEALNVDLVIHVGHNRYPYLSIDLGVDIVYIPAYYAGGVSEELLNDLADMVKREGYKSIGLVATIQHVNILEDISAKLRNKGLEIVVGQPSHSEMLPGQVLGCEYSAALNISGGVEAYIIVSGGYFHALGLVLATQKPVYRLDPYKLEIEYINEFANKILAKRYYLVSKLINSTARSVGLIIGSRPGQYRPMLIKYLAKEISRAGLRYEYIMSTRLDKERLIAIDNAFDDDFYVVTSCPRIPIDDLSDYHKPVLTPGELLMVLRKKIERYVFPW